MLSSRSSPVSTRKVADFLSLPRIQESRECSLRCPDHRPFLEIPDNQGSTKTTLVRCNQCDLVFEDPRPSAEEIRAFYCNSELWTKSTDAEGMSRSYVKEIAAKRPFFEDLAARIERYKPGGQLLDIGSGPGLLEQVLDDNRWSVMGIDRCEYIASLGRQDLGTNVVSGSFEEIDLASGFFDVIVMKYVLDHMEEPYKALIKARQFIRPDGIMVIADLINIESFCARYFRDGFRLIHPMHFTYFSPRTIRYHLGRAGFSVVRIEYPYFRTPYFTMANVWALARKTFSRFLNRYVLRRERRVFAPPFYGSMMDVWAIPT